jgi:hypothetical protein
MIPSNIQGENNCRNAGTAVGAKTEADCTDVKGLAAVQIDYYQFSSQSAMNSGFSAFLKSVKFPSSAASCTTSNKFVDFVSNCKGDFTSTTPVMTGNVAEYVSTDNNPIIVSTDNQQLIMAVIIGTNDSDLLAFWQKLGWIQT